MYFLACCMFRPSNSVWYDHPNCRIPVVAQSKAWVCGHSLAVNAGSNSAGDMEASFECCVFSGTGLCVRADLSSRGVLPTVVCLSVIVKTR